MPRDGLTVLASSSFKHLVSNLGNKQLCAIRSHRLSRRLENMANAPLAALLYNYVESVHPHVRKP